MHVFGINKLVVLCPEKDYCDMMTMMAKVGVGRHVMWQLAVHVTMLVVPSVFASSLPHHLCLIFSPFGIISLLAQNHLMIKIQRTRLGLVGKSRLLTPTIASCLTLNACLQLAVGTTKLKFSSAPQDFHAPSILLSLGGSH